MIALWDIKRHPLSSWLTIAFSLLLFISITLNEFFQKPHQSNNTLESYRKLFSDSQIASIDKITIKNNNGKFQLEKYDTKRWTLKEPRQFPARISVVNNLLKLVKDIDILGIYTKDRINVSNFSLQNPTVEISLGGSELPNATIGLGMMNPIDNTSYITSTTQNVIFHINTRPLILNSIDLPGIIEPRVFFIQKEEMVSIKITHRSDKNSMFLEKLKNDWKNEKKKSLNEQKLFKFIDKINTIKSSVIIDKFTPQVKKTIARYNKNPLFKIEITYKGGAKENITISSAIRKLEGLKIKKWKNVLISTDKYEYPYLVGIDQLKVFYQKSDSLKATSIKKLIY